MPSISLPVQDPALPLGKESHYPQGYDPSLLYSIPRSLGREMIGVNATALPFIGWDQWRAYELSWLNLKGRPQVGLLSVRVPATSTCIVESKSLKLYLNSLNNERFSSATDLRQVIESDLSRAFDAPTDVTICEPDQFGNERIDEQGLGECLDDIDIEIDAYQPDARLLKVIGTSSVVAEEVFTRLLKSNCPVTGQPDWGCLQIKYEGPAIDHASVLRYVVSFRQHQGFHEQCVEQLFCDILSRCQPHRLSVYARYTRRGGLDINPWRATPGMPEPSLQRSAQQ